MGGQTGSQQQQTQQVTQLPPWINEAAQQNYGFAQNVASRPFQQYQGQWTPDTAPQLQQAWNTAATSGNAGIPQYNAATAGFVGALGQTPASVQASTVNPQTLASTNLKPYENPYTQDVINKTLPIMQQNLALQQNQQQDAAAAANAYGGSRQAVQQGVTQAQGAQDMAQMAAQLNQSNFAQAQAAATGDISRNLQAQQGNQQYGLQGQMANQTAQQNKINSDIQAAGGLGQIGQGLGTQAQQAFNMQTSAGAAQQGAAQAQINAQMQKFQQAWGYPTQQLGALQSALGMTPYGQASTGQSNTQTSVPFDWGALAGQALGAGMSFIPKPSDRRLKKNLKKLGVHQPTGTPIYAYNWKGEPPGAPKSLGPMAQDLKTTIPGSVAQHPAGHLVVHPAVLGALARPAPAGTIGAMAVGSKPIRKKQSSRLVRGPQIRGALGG